MKNAILYILLFLLNPIDSETKKVDQTLNDWHTAASQANFKAYFDLMDENSVFIGTAPNERWNKKDFMAFAKPYFDKGKAWDFKSTKRNITISKDGNTAWFDEVLDTWMLDCSGSGVLVKQGNTWKIAFYDLHVLVENEKTDSFINLRKEK